MLLTITYTNGNKLTLSVNYAVAQDGELTYKVRKNPTDISAPVRVPLANISRFAVDPTDNSYNAYKLEKAAREVDGKVSNFTAAVELMDDEIREEIHAEGIYTTEAAFLAEYCRRHLEKYGEEFTF